MAMDVKWPDAAPRWSYAQPDVATHVTDALVSRVGKNGFEVHRRVPIQITAAVDAATTGVSSLGQTAPARLRGGAVNLAIRIRVPRSNPKPPPVFGSRMIPGKVATTSTPAQHCAMPVDFISLFALLAATRIRFVVVGGLAMLLHGVDRLTADADLVIDLAADELPDAIRALTAAGYRPLAPVDPLALADPANRAEWQKSKGMTVFSFWDSTHTRPTVDVLLEAPVPFADLWTRADIIRIGETDVRIASRVDLIRLKEITGRERDQADIEALRLLK